jgi:hypothetical protein
MDPDEKKVLNALMAQVDARELALKMVISVQLVDHVVVDAGDPRISQRQTRWQGLFVNSPLKPFLQRLLNSQTRRWPTLSRESLRKSNSDCHHALGCCISHDTGRAGGLVYMVRAARFSRVHHRSSRESPGRI